MSAEHYHCPQCLRVLPSEPMVESKARDADVLGICGGCKVLVLKRSFHTQVELVSYDKLRELEGLGVKFVHKEDLD